MRSKIEKLRILLAQPFFFLFLLYSIIKVALCISLLLKSSWSFLCADNLLDTCSVLSMLSQASHTSLKSSILKEAYASCVPSLLRLFSLLLKDITRKRRDTKYPLLRILLFIYLIKHFNNFGSLFAHRIKAVHKLFQI